MQKNILPRFDSFVFLLFSFVFLLACSEEGTGPNPKPEGYQEDIPWPSLADSPWPMEHGNPQSTGRAKVSGPVLGDTIWTKSFEGPITLQAFTSPVIGEDGTIYIGSSFEPAGKGQVSYLYAINQDGETLWRFAFDHEKIAATPIVGNDGTIYAASYDHYLYAINPNGTLKWKFDSGEIINYMALNIDKEGTLYFVNLSGTLFAINNDGSEKWKLYIDNGFLASPINGLSISPDGNNLYVPGIARTLYAISISGNVVWSYDNGHKISSMPLVESNGNIFITSGATNYSETKLICLNSSGIVLWEKTGYGTSVLPTIDEFGNSYFTITGIIDSTGIVSFDYLGNKRWRQYELNNLVPLILDMENRIYSNIKGEIVVLERERGQIIQKFSIGYFSVVTPVIIENAIIYPSAYPKKN